jgi:thiamine biosynthesis lipoprotein
MPEAHRRFRALGSDCLVRVVLDDDGAGPRLLDEAVAMVEALEARWSRFRVDSELSRVNAAAGAPTFTSPETASLIALAVDAWRSTHGVFDPTVHDAVVAHGYDRSFEQLDGVTTQASGEGVPTLGAAGIEVDERIGLVVLPPGCHIDLGGIGKGRAADLVLEHLLRSGAIGACVDLGGDVAVAGRTVDGGDDWVIAIDDPFRPGDDLALVRLGAGAVTTSSRSRRRWTTPTGPAHHLIDPRTGRPADSGLTAVTVVSGSAAGGEVQAKAALIAGLDRGQTMLEEAGICGVLVTDQGRVEGAGPIEEFLVGDLPDRVLDRGEP